MLCYWSALVSSAFTSRNRGDATSYRQRCVFSLYYYYYSLPTSTLQTIENWDQKGKFPASLKPMLSQLALLAIKLDEYDEHFFNLMPLLFPYNKFTMSVSCLSPSLVHYSSLEPETHQTHGIPRTHGTPDCTPRRSACRACRTGSFGVC